MRRTWIVTALVLVIVAVFALPAMAQTDAPSEVPDVIFDLAWIGAVIGFFLPLVTSLVKRASWSTQLKRGVAVFTAVVAGLVNTGIQADWQFDTVGQFAALSVFSVVDVYVTAAVIYQNFWKDTDIEIRLESVGDSQ